MCDGRVLDLLRGQKGHSIPAVTRVFFRSRMDFITCHMRAVPGGRGRITHVGLPDLVLNSKGRPSPAGAARPVAPMTPTLKDASIVIYVGPIMSFSAVDDFLSARRFFIRSRPSSDFTFSRLPTTVMLSIFCRTVVMRTGATGSH